MFDSRILDVVLALAAVYALLALGCSWVAEWVAAALGLRARMLEAAIRELLEHGVSPGGAKKPSEVFQHSFVAPLARRITSGSDAKPSHIPTWLLARTLWDLAVPEDTTDAAAMDAIGKIQIPVVRELAEAAVRQGRARAESVRLDIEHLVDAQMERAQGWYARRVQWVLLIIAFVLTAGLNVDSLAIARSVWVDAGVRAAATAFAGQTTGSDAAHGGEASGALDALVRAPVPIGWTWVEGPPTEPAPDADRREYTVALADWQRSVHCCDGGIWLPRLAGWFATILACSLGAPFWFSLLNRLVNLRLGGSASTTARTGGSGPETTDPETSGG